MSDKPKGIGDDVCLLTTALEMLAMAPSVLRAPRWSRVLCFVCGELKLRAVPMSAGCPLLQTLAGEEASGNPAVECGCSLLGEQPPRTQEHGRAAAGRRLPPPSPEHLHVQFHNRIKAVVLERRDGSVGQVYTGAYTEGIEVYFLTLLRLTCSAAQMCLCKETPSGKMGGKVAPGDENALGDVMRWVMRWAMRWVMCWAMGCAGRCTGLAMEESSPWPAGGWEPAAPPPGEAALAQALQ